MDAINKSQNDYIWQDREIRFDSKPTLLATRRGEKIIGKNISEYLFKVSLIINSTTNIELFL